MKASSFQRCKITYIADYRNQLIQLSVQLIRTTKLVDDVGQQDDILDDENTFGGNVDGLNWQAEGFRL